MIEPEVAQNMFASVSLSRKHQRGSKLRVVSFRRWSARQIQTNLPIAIMNDERYRDLDQNSSNTQSNKSKMFLLTSGDTLVALLSPLPHLVWPILEPD